MKRQFAFLFLAMVTALGPLPANGQVRPPAGQQRQRQQMEARVEQGLARLVTEELGLTPDQMASVQTIMQAFREDRREINRSKASLRYRLQDPALAELADEAAEEILAEMIRVQEGELDLYRREQTQLLTVLSPNQLVRFYRIRERWGQRIQELRQPGGRGPGGPPGMPSDPVGGVAGMGPGWGR